MHELKVREGGAVVLEEDMSTAELLVAFVHDVSPIDGAAFPVVSVERPEGQMTRLLTVSFFDGHVHEYHTGPKTRNRLQALYGYLTQARSLRTNPVSENVRRIQVKLPSPDLIALLQHDAAAELGEEHHEARGALILLMAELLGYFGKDEAAEKRLRDMSWYDFTDLMGKYFDQGDLGADAVLDELTS